jgi:MFS transporter, PPP family, 3-phenylpropionic acid transporter
MKTKPPIEVPLALYYLFYFALVGVYVIFMPKVLSQMGYTNAEVGIIYAAAPMMRFLIPFVFRRFITLDNTLYLLSLVTTFVATLLFWVSIESFWYYLGVNLLFGAAMGVSLPFVETIALESLSRSRYGKVRLFGSIGFMAIALWLGRFLDSPHEALLYLTSMTFLTLIFGATIVSYDESTTLETMADSRSFSLLSYPWFWVSIFLMQVGFGGFYNFFTIYETSHGVSLEMTSWLWSFGVICEIVMLYFQGPLLARSLLKLLEFALVITALRWFLLYLFPESLTVAFASQSLHAVSFALYHTASISYVFLLYTQKKLAQQFFLGIAFGLGGSVGAILAGQIYGDSMFLIESLITLLALGALLMHSRRKNSLKDSHG